jgi:hypothetical protein
MYSVPAPVLNEIARTRTLRTESARQMFVLDGPGLLDALSDQAKSLGAQGVPNKVVLAYQTVGPLLSENLAISEFIMTTERLDLRACLPEIVSIEEAILVADAEYRLAEDEKDCLCKLIADLSDDEDAPARADSLPDPGNPSEVSPRSSLQTR